MESDRLRGWGPALKAAFGLALFTAALWVFHRELRAYHYADLAAAVAGLPRSRLLAAGAATALGYLALTGYDVLALRYVGATLAYRWIALASFVGYAASQNLGFPLLTGASLRYRLYSRWGIASADIARAIGFYSTTFWLGFLALGGIALLADPPATGTLPVPAGGLRALGALMLGALIAYYALVALRPAGLRLGKWRFSLPGPRLAAAQLAISSVDWALAAAALYLLLPPGAVSFPRFLAIFLVGQLAGVLSHLPGGVGVFETVLLLSLRPALPEPVIVGVLLAYRVIYYLLPLAVAALLLGVYEATLWRERSRAVGMLARSVSYLVPGVTSALVFVAGAILLFSGATPAAAGRLAWLDRMLPLSMIELSHVLASMAGVGLLLLARGLQFRVDAAYHLTVALLLAGIVFSLMKGLDYEEAAALTLVLAMLRSARREFHRPSSLIEERFSPGWIGAIAAVLIGSVAVGLFSFKHVPFDVALSWRFGSAAEAARFLRATVGGLAVISAFGLARLLHPPRPEAALPDEAELERATVVVQRCPRAEANLALVGDKALLFNDAGSAFLMYGVIGRTWVAMGDPVGPEAEWDGLVWRFRELCDRHATRPVLYEISRQMLPLCLELGLSLVKLGEEARVPLASFSLAGGERKSLRRTFNAVEREGCAFEMVQASAVDPLLPELRAISDAWLEEKQGREKGFSLGRFDEAYIRRLPVGLVRSGGRIVAFANVWPGAEKEELSVDLMRYLPGAAPPGVMEYLFLQLMLWGQAQEYRWFSLGMAPLSGLDTRREAPLWSRLGAFVFRHGEHFYNFQGLRLYKEKFDPVWEPRYLASPGRLALPRVLADVSALVAGGYRGIFS